MKKEWWKNTFGPHYFLAWDESHTHERTSKEINFAIKVLHLKNGNEVLDSQCGQGRHAIELTKAGFRVTGIDYSPFLLDIAKKRAKINKRWIVFLKRDIRRLKLRKKFNAIINLGNSFGYFNDKDNEQVIKNFSNMLKAGGGLILDLANTIGMLRHKTGKRKISIRGGRVETEQVSFDPQRLVSKLEWNITKGHHTKILRGQIRFYTFPEIKMLLEKHGLVIRSVYGSFGMDKYNIDSPRMIVVAEKKK